MTLDMNGWVEAEVRKLMAAYEAGEMTLGWACEELYELLEHASVEEILAPLPWWLRPWIVMDIDQRRDMRREDTIYIGADCVGADYDHEAAKNKALDRFFGKIYPKMEIWHRAHERTDRWPTSVCLYWGDDTVFRRDALSPDRPRYRKGKHMSSEERKDPVLRARRIRVNAAIRAMAEIEHEREQAVNL